MTTYLVRLKGQNFLMGSDGGPRKMGFYTTRLVDAENPKRAETLALEYLRSDARLRNTVLNKASDPPMIDLDSVSEIPAAAYDAQNRANALHWEGVLNRPEHWRE